MRESPIKTRVMDYVLQHKAEHGSYPSGVMVARMLGIGKTTANYYINCLREDGIIGEKDCRMKDRPAEDRVYDFIMQYDAEHGEYPPICVIADSVGSAKQTVRSHIARMLREGRIENKNGVYNEPSQDYVMSRRSMRDIRRIDDGIRNIDIRKVKDRIKIGDKVYVEDGYVDDLGPNGVIQPVYARVVSVHRHVVQLTGHLSCTLSQLAAGEKRKKKAGKKGKTWIAVRWMNTNYAILSGERS